MNYKKMNIYLGWVVFLIATIVYFITIEDTVSLWDCGEYITAAYKLEVGHPPGAPLFMILGRLFSFFAEPTEVAVWINRLSALCSSASILFMFWSINLLVRKMIMKTKAELSSGDIIAILGSGLVGSLAYTFTDSFWFSAVEGEVYSMASLFTAVIFWAILKWDEEMEYVQAGKLTEEYAPNRWLILIMFLLGLAIGVHLLGILLVPAIGYVIYFRYWQTVTPVKFVLTGVLSVVILGFIQEVIIPGSISMASSFEVTFRNSLGLPFFSGAIFFFVLLIGIVVFGLRYARRKNKTILYNSLMGLIVLLIGYGSFAVIVIRSNANPPLDENNPENLVTLHSYLKREQYGSSPILKGPHWNSKENGGVIDENGQWKVQTTDEWGSRSPFYLRRFVVTKGEAELKAFIDESHAAKFAKENGAEYEERYFESNEGFRENVVATYSQTTFFPRMFNSDEPRKVQGYKDWSGYDPSEVGELGSDGLRLPTMGENLTYFIDYQCNWMYFRYFMWNFAGRQNDYQGHGDAMRGNWISGISAIDNARLGNQDEAPYYTTHNPANNKLFFFPLILGLLGLFFHAYKSPKDAFVVFLGFLFTGLAIVVYLNQRTFEPRERDYAYAGSFYFFAMWIGVAVYAMYYAFTTFTRKHFIKGFAVFGAGLLFFLIVDTGAEVSMPATMSWIFIGGIALGLLGLMFALRKVLKKELHGAVVATLIALIAPIVMGMQEWDDHDRSNKTTAHDLAANYLDSVSDNGIIFTNGDNDTFPLWYMQEVEGYRTDVRVCNLSLMQTDWYSDEMKMRAYESDPLPIKYTEDQILMYAGATDQTQFIKVNELFMVEGLSEKTIKKVIDLHLKNNKQAALTAINGFAATMNSVVAGISVSQPNAQARVAKIKAQLTSVPTDLNALGNDIYTKYRGIFEIFGAYQNGIVSMEQPIAQALQKSIETLAAGWESVDLKDAMDFARDDANLHASRGRMIRFIPSNKFDLTVNKENVLKSGITKEKDKSKFKSKITFSFDVSGITREELMMLEIIANNDWKRGIYFSSPGGSKLSTALFYGGAIRQNGMAFMLSPMKEVSQVAADDMYDNMMNSYKYGKTSDPNVLTDYYARRHTSQYRLHFATLAQYYVQQILKTEDVMSRGPQYLEYLRSVGQNDNADESEYMLKNGKAIVSQSKKRISELLKRSLELMPPAIVLDNGEPSQKGGKPMNVNGVDFVQYQDGTLTDYVDMLYRAGDKKTAGELGLELTRQYETVINFFLKSTPNVAMDARNHADLLAAVNNYIEIVVSSNDEQLGDPTGKLAKESKSYIVQLYAAKLKGLYAEIEQVVHDNGETVRSGGSNPIATRYLRLRDNLDALGSYYGIIQGKEVAPQEMDPMEGMDLNQLLEQQQNAQPIEDSVNN